MESMFQQSNGHRLLEMTSSGSYRPEENAAAAAAAGNDAVAGDVWELRYDRTEHNRTSKCLNSCAMTRPGCQRHLTHGNDCCSCVADGGSSAVAGFAYAGCVDGGCVDGARCAVHSSDSTATLRRVDRPCWHWYRLCCASHREWTFRRDRRRCCCRPN